MKDNFDFSKSLQERYTAAKKGARAKSDVPYDPLLILLSHHELSMNEIAFLFDVPPQNTHVKLKRLRDYGLIKREKKEGRSGVKEYQHFLAPDVDPTELQELTGDELPPEVNERLQQLLSGDQIDIHQPLKRVEAPLSVVKNPTGQSSRSFQPTTLNKRVEQLCSRLPIWDEAWPDEKGKNIWMSSFKAITKLRLMDEVEGVQEVERLERLLSMLPSFDSNWPEKRKDDWLASVHAIVETR